MNDFSETLTQPSPASGRGLLGRHASGATPSIEHTPSRSLSRARERVGVRVFLQIRAGRQS